MDKRILQLLTLFLLMPVTLLPQKKVYIVLGSDTAIWEGMSVPTYSCHYNFSVIPDVTRHYFKSMQASYRNTFNDSYGGKAKITWWLMGGNIYRYGDNLNVPYANTMVPWIAKKYYGAQFLQFGDELSMHYHSFVWSDYNNDGQFFWNQGKRFDEYKADFDYTLAQYLIEENIFPVSFRAGWNFMDTEWQNYLDRLLPYSMHNQYPAVARDTIEPLDNSYDWSHSSPEYVPFHPSPLDYQLAGNLKGYNLRSSYFGGFSQSAMNNIFSKANSGTDQVVCIWGHVWDATFLEGMQRIDTLAHVAAAKYPEVKFKYCTAVEAMQLWRKTVDFTPPQLTFTLQSGLFTIQSDEAIFQEYPFVAVKDIYENYHVLPCVSAGTNRWQATLPFLQNLITVAGVAVTDTSGNLATKFLQNLPADLYIDNESPDYTELHGNWTTATTAVWGLNSRQATIATGDSAAVRWSISVPEQKLYNVFIQFPKNNNACSNVRFRLFSSGQQAAEIYLPTINTGNEWVHLGTWQLAPGNNSYIEMTASGVANAGKILMADVIKVSSLIRPKDLHLKESLLKLGEISRYDSLNITLHISNRGVEDAMITGISSAQNLIRLNNQLPVTVAGMGKTELRLIFVPGEEGIINDTLLLYTDDTQHQIIRVPYSAKVSGYFTISDNEDSLGYTESGNWAYSNAFAFGNNSRYAVSNQSPKPFAVFKKSPKLQGTYDISYIVPTTQNASNNAVYIIRQGIKHIDSLQINQNTGSGSWVKLGTYPLSADSVVSIAVYERGSTIQASVLRADAVKIAMITSSAEDDRTLDEHPPMSFNLHQNFPNPFNPSTRISFTLPIAGSTTLQVFTVLGSEVSTLVNARLEAGSYSMLFNAGNLSSGVYFYRVTTDGKSICKKMLLAR